MKTAANLLKSKAHQSVHTITPEASVFDAGLADALPLAKAGRVRIVAITGTRRSSVFPEVPTFEELGYPA